MSTAASQAAQGQATAAKAGSIKDQLAAPAAKKSKTEKDVTVKFNEARTLLSRTASGYYKSATQEQKDDAQAGMDMLKTCSKDEKMAFALKMEQTKGNKTFAWVRDFKESLKSTSHTSQSVLENYYTRIVM